MFKGILKAIFSQHAAADGGPYLRLLSEYIEAHTDVSQVVSYQWLEAWMDSTINTPEISSQGLYYFPMHKECFYELYCDSLTKLITQKLGEFGYQEIGQVLALVEAPDNTALSEIEFTYGKEFYSLVSEEPDELLNLLLYCYCRANNISISSIDTNLNGQYSVMAAAHNERIALYEAIYDIINGSPITPTAAATISSNWGPSILHMFSQNEIERQRAERELTRKVTLPL